MRHINGKDKISISGQERSSTQFASLAINSPHLAPVYYEITIKPKAVSVRHYCCLCFWLNPLNAELNPICQ